MCSPNVIVILKKFYSIRFSLHVHCYIEYPGRTMLMVMVNTDQNLGSRGNTNQFVVGFGKQRLAL